MKTDFPERTFDIRDNSTLKCVAFLYSGKFFESESEHTRSRIRQNWYPVEIPRYIDYKTIMQMCSHVQDQLAIYCVHVEGDNSKYINLKLDDKRVYFRESQDAIIAKLYFSG